MIEVIPMSDSHGSIGSVKENVCGGKSFPETPPLTAEQQAASLLSSVADTELVVRLHDVLTAEGKPPTLREICAMMLKTMLAVGVTLLVEYLCMRDRAVTKACVGKLCPKCKQAPLRRKKTVTIQRKSLLGVLCHRRSLVECGSCDYVVIPLDLELEVGGGKKSAARHEHAFISLLVYMCTLLPFDRGCELFVRATNQQVSSQLAQGLCEGIGGWLVEEQMAKAEMVGALFLSNPDLFVPGGEKSEGRTAPGRVYVMQDNSKMGINDGKRGRGAPRRKKPSYIERARRQARRKKAQKAKRGIGDWEHEENDGDDEQAGFRDARAVLIFRDEDLVRYEGGRTYLTRRRIVAHIGTLEEWTNLLRMAFFEEGVFWASEVIFIADGGNGIWQQFEELVPPTPGRKVYNILDWYHAASYLYKVALAVKGSRTKDERFAAVEWVAALIDELKLGHPSVILQRLRKLRLDSHTSQETLRKCIEYFEAHQSRMLYGKFRRQGLLIGSGAVESLHAWMIQNRMRLPGMRWSVAGANRMLRLRCSWASGTFDEDIAAFLTTRRTQGLPMEQQVP